MKNDLSDVVLGFDVRFEVQLCDVHEKRVRHGQRIRSRRGETIELQEALVEATVCGMCNIVGAEFSGEIDDLELEEVFGEERS